MNQLAVPIFSLIIQTGHLCRKSSGDIGHGALVGIQRERSQTTILQKQPVCLEVPVKIKQKLKKHHIITPLRSEEASTTTPTEENQKASE